LRFFSRGEWKGRVAAREKVHVEDDGGEKRINCRPKGYFRILAGKNVVKCLTELNIKGRAKGRRGAPGRPEIRDNFQERPHFKMKTLFLEKRIVLREGWKR